MWHRYCYTYISRVSVIYLIALVEQNKMKRGESQYLEITMAGNQDLTIYSYHCYNLNFYSSYYYYQKAGTHSVIISKTCAETSIFATLVKLATRFENCEFRNFHRVTYFRHYKLRRLLIYVYIPTPARLPLNGI